MAYLPRVVDTQIADMLGGLPAIAIDGAKGVGKTASASRLASTIFELDDAQQRAVLALNHKAQLASAAPPILIDEWQFDPPVWDAVRRLVDDDRTPGRFLLTGSANPRDTRIHSGAGRIVHVRMRPLAFSERAIETPNVSLRALLEGNAQVAGNSKVSLDTYVDEILSSGLPGMRAVAPRWRMDALDSYLADAVNVQIPELGAVVRRPESLTAWLRAYAAATSTTATFARIGDAVSRELRPARSTVIDYRDALAQLWLLDEVPAWREDWTQLSQLGRSPKHQLADPALAARLLGVERTALMRARTLAETDAQLSTLHHGPFLGALFESLVTLSVRVYAEPTEFKVSHVRTRRGDHEIDLLLHHADGRVLPIEVKLGQVPSEHDLRHLRWLRRQLGDRVIDALVVTTGPVAYRTADGIAVVPLALLGP